MAEETRLDPVMRRAPLGELKVWEIQEHELDSLEKGSPASILLNFSLTLIPVSLSLFLTLITVDVPSVKTFTVYVCLTAIFFVIGVICLVLWYQNHVSAKTLVKQIRNRMPRAEGIQETSADSRSS